MKNKKMKKKILEVKGSGRYQCLKVGSGSFHTSHKPEDVEKWLEHKQYKNNSGGEVSVNEFRTLFKDSLTYNVIDESLDEVEVDINESHLSEKLNRSYDEKLYDEKLFNTILKNMCRFDDEIQTFLDEENRKKFFQV